MSLEGADLAAQGGSVGQRRRPVVGWFARCWSRGCDLVDRVTACVGGSGRTDDLLGRLGPVVAAQRQLGVVGLVEKGSLPDGQLVGDLERLAQCEDYFRRQVLWGRRV